MLLEALVQVFCYFSLVSKANIDIVLNWRRIKISVSLESFVINISSPDNMAFCIEDGLVLSWTNSGKRGYFMAEGLESFG